MNYFDNLFDIKDKNNYGVSGLTKELNALYIYNCFIKKNKNILIVTNTVYEANELYIKLLNYTSNVLFFPMDDFITSEAIAISPEFKTERITSLNKIVSSDRNIVITNLMGLLRYLPTKKLWKQKKINIKKQEDVNRDKLINDLYELGYEKEILVNETGKFAVRGYVIDVFPVGMENPVRIEFWGDTVDSIKLFDYETQLTISEIDEVEICSNTEFLIEDYNDEVISKQKYLKYYSDKVSNISDYLDDCLCFWYDYNQIEISYKLLKETIFEYDKENVSTIKTNYMFDLEELNIKNEIYIMGIDNILNNVKLDDVIKYSSYNIDNFEGNLELFKKYLEKNIIKKNTVILAISNSVTAKKLVQYLELSNLVLTNPNEIIKGKINLINYSIGNGFIFDNCIVISNNDIFKTQKKSSYKSKFKLANRLTNLSNINKGDYIVHEMYGIGIYDEIVTLTKNGYKKDYIRLIYADGDVLYVPVEKIDRISKFVGKEVTNLKLNKLNSDEWEKRKSKIKNKLHDIAGDLIKVSAEREMMKGFAFSEDDENQVLFDSEFIYTETEDQLKAINNIKMEMEKSKPMDMLLCGDVGYGKTEVAFRAIFKAVNDGKQVAYLCPTTILSSQQYNSAISRFSSFPVNIALLNRFVSYSKQKEIIEDVNNGKIDILFGTHKILSDKIKFKDLGLLVIDEEQRFGVTHKEKIKKYKSNIDVLTLSATPIPRTLQLSMSGIRSLSLIETPPEDRLPIQTYVLVENKNVVKDAIYKELSRDGQVFILYNRVEKLDMIKKEEGNLKSYMSFIQKENNEAIMSFGEFDSQFDRGDSNKCFSEYGYYFGCQVLAIKIGVNEIYTPSTGKVEIGIFSISEEYLILPSKPGNETIFYYKNKIKELFGIECIDESKENDEMINITCDYFNYEDLPDLYFEMKGGIGVMALSVDMFKILANYKMEFKIKHRKKNDDNSFFNKWILGEPVTKNYNFFANYTDKDKSYVIVIPASLNGFILILIATVGGFVFLLIFLSIIYCSARKENKYKNEFYDDNKKMNLRNNIFSMDKNNINEVIEEHENEIEENEKEEDNKINDDNNKDEIENNIIFPKESKEELFDKDNDEIKNLKINDIQNDNSNNKNKKKTLNEKDINKKPNNVGVELITNNDENLFDEKDTFM